MTSYDHNNIRQHDDDESKVDVTLSNHIDRHVAVNTVATNTITKNPLMTPKALSLSWSPPRAPPFDTYQHAIYHQKKKKMFPYDDWWWQWSHQQQYDQRHYHVRSIAMTTDEHDVASAETTTKIQQRWIHPTIRKNWIRQQQQHKQKQVRNDNSNNSNSSSRTTTQQQQQLKRTSDGRNNRNNNNIYSYPKKHPYLSSRSNDTVTRILLGIPMISISFQNYVRDSGLFRWMVDTIATTTIPPAIVLSNRTPVSKILQPYLRLSQLCNTIPYGTHPSQYIHLYQHSSSPILNQEQSKHSNSNNTQPPRRLIVFVHGGAWGSGQPWMYRLIAAPFLFPDQRIRSSSNNNNNNNKRSVQPPYCDHYCYSVAIVGHRTYPDGNTVHEQVSDVRMALDVLIERYSHLYTDTNITIIGHSSGAHIALLMVVDSIIEQLDALQQRVDDGELQSNDLIVDVKSSLPFDSICGISGPYDISHHFDFEAARGVEELSPMKPVNGYTRSKFQSNSPVWRLRKALMYLHPNVESMMQRLCPNMAFIHGIEDDTVPFTATAEVARSLRALVVDTTKTGTTTTNNKIQEIYVPYTGHQDAILQFMLGGTTCDIVMEYISNLRHHHTASLDSTPPQQSIVELRSRL